MLLSFVIPCYRSENTIRNVVEEIRGIVAEREEYDYEIICVNDCSPDDVYTVLQQLAKEDKRIKVINFAKNMGKHAAVLAGYSVVKGDIVVNLDDDMQSPMDHLWELVDPMVRDECDVVTANYRVKKQAVWKNMGSAFNRWVSGLLLDKPKELHFDNFNAMKVFVAKEMIKYKNPYPFLDGLIVRTTGRIKAVEMDERNRGDSNTTGYTLKKSIALFLNGFTAFSVKPLQLATAVGVISAVAGFLWAVYLIVKKVMNPSVEVGYTSMLVFILFIGGLLLISQGMLGEYIGRIYICLNASPQYVIRDTLNIEAEPMPDRQSNNEKVRE